MVKKAEGQVEVVTPESAPSQANCTMSVYQNQSPSPAELMNTAIANGVDIDKLEKMLVLQERWENNEAIKAYNKAMAQFKANPPHIDKDRQVKYSTGKGSVGYSHATLGNVVEKITAELSKYGMSMSWRTAQVDKNITVTCRLSHERGHYEETSISAQADDSGAKNPIQAVGSTISYLQRYSCLALTGLATYDQDTDGVTVEEKIDANKVEIITKLVAELGVDIAKFLQYMAVASIEEIPASQFAKAKVMLESRRAKK